MDDQIRLRHGWAAVSIRKEKKQMTQLLQQAFEKTSELPQEEQDNFARFLCTRRAVLPEPA